MENLILARMIKTLACSITGEGGMPDPEKAEAIAKGIPNQRKIGMYEDDFRLHGVLKALSQTIPSEGGFLTPSDYYKEITDIFLAKTNLVKLCERIPLPYGGMNFAGLNTGATATYENENTDMAITAPSFKNNMLSTFKLRTFSVLSNDLLKNASIAADRIVQNHLARIMGIKMDQTLLYGDSSLNNPTGVRYSMTTAQYTVTTATISYDVPWDLQSTLLNANVPMEKPSFVFNSRAYSTLNKLITTTNVPLYRDELQTGKLITYPYEMSNVITTAQITASITHTDMWLIDFAFMMFGESTKGTEVLVSNEASYLDGTGTMQSCFANDQTAIRLQNVHGFSLIQPNAATAIQISYQ